MFPFFTPQALTNNALIAATKTMLKVAHTDGLHPAEAALIEAFYNSGTDAKNAEQLPTFASLNEGVADFSVAAASFGSDEEREMVLALSVMTGFADGTFSEHEQQVVNTIASSLQIAGARVNEIIEAVKDHMLAQLSHLPDAASIAVVAKELG